MSDSESSALSSPPSTEDEVPVAAPKPQKSKPKAKRKANRIDTYTTTYDEPPAEELAPPDSPPHEETLADNPDIAFIVMFRSRFSEAFPTKLVPLGPQDIERGVVDPLPSPQVESLLCALLGLVLNRKKPVERGHYGRALEEAIQTQKSQWPSSWKGINPLHGGNSFNSMSHQQRLNLLKTLILWSLNTSDLVTGIIKESYKQSRHNDDKNQPLSVQPWGKDTWKRQYWLVEGQDDTSFRLYRESDRYKSPVTWWSVAGSIDELKIVAEKLAAETAQSSHRLSEAIKAAIPRFEATEEKRKRREYRLARKAQFSRPEPGFSLYEGRTRGKRMRYTFSDEEEDGSDATSTRRSTRHSGIATPADPSKPTVTASGRQVRSRVGGLYGESLLSGQTTDGASPATGDYERSEISEEPPNRNGRATRSAGRTATNGWAKGHKHIEGYNSVDEMDDEDEATSSGGEWNGGDDDNDDADDNMDDADEDDEDLDEEASQDEKPSLVVQLRYRKPVGGGGDSAMNSAVDPSTNASLQPSTASSSTAASFPVPSIVKAEVPVNGFPAQTSGVPSGMPPTSAPFTDTSGLGFPKVFYSPPVPPIQQLPVLIPQAKLQQGYPASAQEHTLPPPPFSQPTTQPSMPQAAPHPHMPGANGWS